MSIAREIGTRARINKMPLGTNPYDPEAETADYEAWLDGWTEEDEECRNYEALFTS